MDYLLQIPDPVPADLEYASVPELLHLKNKSSLSLLYSDSYQEPGLMLHFYRRENGTNGLRNFLSQRV